MAYHHEARGREGQGGGCHNAARHPIELKSKRNRLFVRHVLNTWCIQTVENEGIHQGYCDDWRNRELPIFGPKPSLCLAVNRSNLLINLNCTLSGRRPSHIPDFEWRCDTCCLLRALVVERLDTKAHDRRLLSQKLLDQATVACLNRHSW